MSGFSPTEEDRNKQALDFIEHVTKNTEKIQDKVLTEILSRNAHVEYLQRHGLHGCTDRESFKKVIPMVTYEELLPDIQRIVNGDTSPVLCSQPICEFIKSSATSGGENKLFPITEEELQRRILISGLNLAIINQFMVAEGFIEKEDGIGKCMYFLVVKVETESPGGLPVCLGSSSLYKRLISISSKNQLDRYTSPPETTLCTDSFQSMYSQALCGLAQREEVIWVGSSFALSFIWFIKFIERHWKSLSNDIRFGTSDPIIMTDPTVRKVVSRVLVGPNPDLADLVEAECGKESWRGIIRRLWPKTKFINVIVTGAMAQYVATLDYYGDGLPLVSLAYFSSECFFGLNLNPLCKPSEVSYTLLPNMAYYEFLPITDNDGGKEMVDLVDVQLGKEYELVLTTYCGLYRYRMGDVLRVAGFYNNTPQFNFVRRANVILSIDQDKTDEIQLHNAVSSAATNLCSYNYSLVDYTSNVDASSIPGHYVIFWEISYNGSSSSVCNSVLPSTCLEDCCLTIEESLDNSYREYRAPDGSIGPLEIRVVKSGTFDELMDNATSATGTTSISQYKTPKCINNPHMLQILNSRVVSKHFSPKCPTWAPSDHNEEN